MGTYWDDVVDTGVPTARVHWWWRRCQRRVISNTVWSKDGSISITTVNARPWWSRWMLVVRAMLSLVKD